MFVLATVFMVLLMRFIRLTQCVIQSMRLSHFSITVGAASVNSGILLIRSYMVFDVMACAINCSNDSLSFTLSLR